MSSTPLSRTEKQDALQAAQAVLERDPKLVEAFRLSAIQAKATGQSGVFPQTLETQMYLELLKAQASLESSPQ